MIRFCSPFEAFVITLMVGAGSLITIVLKWADQLPSLNSIGENATFSHPFLQSTFMFLGELFCIALFYLQRWCRRSRRHININNGKNDNEESNRGSESNLIGDEKKKFLARRSWILIPASLCDMTGISLSYFALTLTSVSSYEMLKGAVIIFTGINSKVFLRRKISWKKWAAMLVTLIGLIIVGLADVLQPAENDRDQNTTSSNTVLFDNSSLIPKIETKCDANETSLSNEVVGDIMVVAAQIFMSFQFVYEEKVLSSYDIAPLQAVGWEGLYGLIVMSVVLVPLSYIDIGTCTLSNSPSPPWTLENPIDGFIQLGNNGLLLFLFCSYVLLVAFYMYGSIAVTKEFNATTRMVLESTRSVIVWIVSLCVGWQHFQYLQLVGFCILTSGIFLYNYKWNT